jgi:hypothetical protein
VDREGLPDWVAKHQSDDAPITLRSAIGEATQIEEERKSGPKPSPTEPDAAAGSRALAESIDRGEDAPTRVHSVSTPNAAPTVPPTQAPGRIVQEGVRDGIGGTASTERRLLTSIEPHHGGIGFGLREAPSGLDLIAESRHTEATNEFRVNVRDIRRRSDQRQDDAFVQTRELHPSGKAFEPFELIGSATQMFHGDSAIFAFVRVEGDGHTQLVIRGWRGDNPASVVITTGGRYQVQLLWTGQPGSGAASVQFEWEPGSLPTKLAASSNSY